MEPGASWTLARGLRAFFAHPGNGILGALALGALGLATRHPLGAWLPMLGLGVVTFPLWEHAVHRFVLHAPPLGGAGLRRLQARLHHDHHREPGRLAWLFAPSWAPGALALAVGGAYHACLPAGAAWGLLAGNLLCFWGYEWVHFRAHVPLVPRSPWGRAMKKYHLWHHHKHEKLWFGVTTPFADHLFGTYRPVEAVAPSPTVRELYPS